ncbi:MAG: 2-amino-4-hydroxy-6-hydroxymethyldihydropteridine diphosphokinase [Pseudomonadota bacterium]
MVQAFVGIGANLGDAQAAVRQALRDIAALPGTRLVQGSSLWRSEPVDASGPDFINAVAEVETALDAHALLAQLQALETRAGRERPWPNAPRTLDLDLLFHGDACIDTATLTLPHPRWTQRAFVLRPLAEIAPQRVSAQQLQAVAAQRIERLG